MIGHAPLVAMRTKGIKPAAVYLSDDLTQIARDWHAPLTLSGQPMPKHSPHIAIEPADRIRSLDLRFLVGLCVFVSSDDEKRAKAIFEACKQAGAALVVGAHIDAHQRHTNPNNWIEIFDGATHG